MSVSVCPACSQENPDVARFCLHCGAALEQQAHREERRVVSVLFVDIVGFTSRSEELDPEDVRSFLTPYYERVRGEIEHHGGRIEKFIGDAVVGIFGAPIAYGDDAERAVRAALAIRDELGKIDEGTTSWTCRFASRSTRVRLSSTSAQPAARAPRW